jgi:phage terminase large subunit-like protein
VTPQQKLERLSELILLAHEASTTLGIKAYVPYPKQRDFHAAGKDNREVALIASSQCVSPWTFVETPEGERRFSEVVSETDGCVLGLVDGQKRAVRWRNAILKGIEPAYRILLDNGRVFDCSRKHRVLTDAGWISLGQLVQRASGLRWMQTHAYFLASCDADGYLDGQRLRAGPDTVQDGLPLPDGVQSHNQLVFSREDAEARTPEYIRVCLQRGPLTIAACGQRLLADLNGQFSTAMLPHSGICMKGSGQVFLQFLEEAGHQLQSFSEAYLDQAFSDFLESHGYRDMRDTFARVSFSDQGAPQSLSVVRPGSTVEELHRDRERTGIFFPFDMASLYGGVKILAVIPIGYQPIIDIEVPDCNNYFAAGVVHHNSGKTYAAAAELAMHLTGIYADDWPGRRWARPTSSWAAGESGESTRDSVQKYLFGEHEFGTGTIPKDCLIGAPHMSRGTSGLIDFAEIRHVSGGVSRIGLKSYGKGRERWQSATLDGIWFDEQPDMDVYSEGMTRVQKRGGNIMLTFTPLKGPTNVVLRLLETAPGRAAIRMTIYDALHYTDEERAVIIAKTPEHERRARIYGEPYLGSGLVFIAPSEQVVIDPFNIHAEWPRIVGIDFGWGDHPTAAVWLAHDRDSDKVYVTDEYRSKEVGLDRHASAIGRRVKGIPVAWPHDGLMRDKGSGVQIAEMYRNEGLNMNIDRSQFEDDRGYGVEAGVAEMNLRFSTGRLLVFSNCGAIMEEYRSYHRKDGVIVKERDDLLSAIRYALMSLRYAETVGEMRSWQRKIQYPQLGIA